MIKLRDDPITPHKKRIGGDSHVCFRFKNQSRPLFQKTNVSTLSIPNTLFHSIISISQFNFTFLMFPKVLHFIQFSL